MSVISSLAALNISPDALGLTEAQANTSTPQEGTAMTFTLPQSIEQPKLNNISTTAPVPYDGTAPTTWGQAVRQMVLDVNQSQTLAGEKVRDVMAGGKTTIDEAMVAVQDANTRFQFLAELRTNALTAYQQVMQMQV